MSRKFLGGPVFKGNLAWLALSTSIAYAQVTAHFDLPAQPLAISLKAIAKQTNTNVLFDLKLVDGLRAKPLKADLTPEAAIDRLLNGTGIHREMVNEHTIVLSEVKPLALSSTALRQGSTDPPAGVRDPRADDAGTERVAQVDASKTQVKEGPDNTTAQAQQAAANQSDQTLQEVVITGSLISRTDHETPSPVQILSSEQIQHSGYTDISDILRNISANGANTLSQAFPGAFASGASGVSLRGLTVADTLTLIDGHRTVDYPLADDNQRAFVDISAIPINAIDRVEVLKDGASSIYGAQAIGGVVNVVLKKTYTGAEFTAEGGTSEKNDGTLEHFAGIYGLGDLGSDGWNGWLAVDFHHQDQIRASNRDGLFANLDWAPYGGVNTTPGRSDNPFFPFPSSITGYLINPMTTAANATQPGMAFLPGCNATAFAANQCTYSIPNLQIQPATEQINLLSKITKSLGENWEAHLELSFFESKADQILFNYGYQAFANGSAYPTGLFNVYFSPTSPTPRISPTTPLIATVPANYPGNPYGAPAALVISMRQLGPAGSEIETDTNTYRADFVVNGKQWGWDFDGSTGFNYARMIQDFYGTSVLNPVAFQDALNNGYIVGENASPNGGNLFAPPLQATPASSLLFLDLHASRPLFDLPGGPLSLAIGSQYFHTVQNDQAPPAAAAGLQGQPGGPVFSIGSQEDVALFSELNAQILKSLEVDAAFRYDHYDTYGSSTTPKFGVKFQPFEQIALRGTWSKGFRAPSPSEGQLSEETFAATGFADPVLCPHPNGPQGANTPGNFPSQCSFAPASALVSNPQLKAVTSTEYTLGIVFEPIKQFNVSADYYNIKLSNDIIASFEAGGLQDYLYLVRNTTPSVLPYVTPSGAIVKTPTPVGTVLFDGYGYINAGTTNTSGFDIDLHSFYDVPVIGKFSADLSYTHLMSYEFFASGQLFQLAGTHGPSGISGDTGNPKDRAVLALSWDKGPAEVTATINYTGAFSITDPSAGEFTCTETLDDSFSIVYGPRFAVSAPPSNSFCFVHSFTDVDLYGRYKLTKNFDVHGSILNLFNRQPPLDLASYGAGGGLAYDTAFGGQAGAIGRFFMIGATWKF
jgi:iron complex outermembrane receptor protein